MQLAAGNDIKCKTYVVVDGDQMYVLFDFCVCVRLDRGPLHLLQIKYINQH